MFTRRPAAIAIVKTSTRRRHVSLAVLALGVALLFVWMLFLGSARAAESAQCQVYFGTYTRGESQGIYVSTMDLSTGELSLPELAAEVTNPSFLAIHPTGRYVYAVSEVADVDGSKSGAVVAFSRDPKTGALTRLNHALTGGGGPCHLVVDAGGQFVLVANYGGGSVAVLPIVDQGRLASATSSIQHEGSSVDPRRQSAPHAHSINLDGQNRFAAVGDLGLDKVLIYRFDGIKGQLAPHEPAFAEVEPGAGPRHFVFHPTNAFAYVINELHSTITAFRYDNERGVLSEIQTLTTLPEGFSENNSTAEVQVHPTGRFLYGSNRGHDSIAVFSINLSTGELTPVQIQSTHGETPRNFGIDPSGNFLLAANQNTDNVVVLKIDQTTGELSPTEHEISLPSPVCVKFVAPGK